MFMQMFKKKKKKGSSQASFRDYSSSTLQAFKKYFT
jgi:hypothetical protein